jgi:hypothetical protein
MMRALTPIGEVRGTPKLVKNGKDIYSDLQFCRRSDTALFYIDVTTVNPTANTYIKTDGLPTPDHATTLREIEKATQYEGIDSHPQNRLIHFAVECTGKLGKAARDFLKEAGLDEKKRTAIKNEIATIVAFANGECISMAYLKGSTRSSDVRIDDYEGEGEVVLRVLSPKSKFGLSQQPKGLSDRRIAQLGPQRLGDTIPNQRQDHITGGHESDPPMNDRLQDRSDINQSQDTPQPFNNDKPATSDHSNSQDGNLSDLETRTKRPAGDQVCMQNETMTQDHTAHSPTSKMVVTTTSTPQTAEYNVAPGLITSPTGGGICINHTTGSHTTISTSPSPAPVNAVHLETQEETNSISAPSSVQDITPVTESFVGPVLQET